MDLQGLLSVIAAMGAIAVTIIQTKSAGDKRKVELLESTSASAERRYRAAQARYEIAREHMSTCRYLLKVNGIEPPPLPEELRLID